MLEDWTPKLRVDFSRIDGAHLGSSIEDRPYETHGEEECTTSVESRCREGYSKKDLSPKLPSRVARRRRRVVSFCPTKEIFQASCCHSKEEIEATWYSKVDYESFQYEIDTTLDVIAAGLTDPERRGGYCFRGLEYKTRQVGCRRSVNIQKARRAVFRVQDRFENLRRRNRRIQEVILAELGESTDDESSCSSSYSSEQACEILSKNNEWDLIAATYEECSLPCRHEAHRMGVWDAKTASLLWRKDKVPKAPTRTWAKAG